MERRLAAILAADVVEYTRLMGEDAATTLEALKQFRGEIFTPLVDRSRGRLVRSMGDGWIVEFSSVGDAVGCSIAIQQHLQSDRMIRLRMGIHLGDIAIEEDDVFGEGVNVAARLEQLASPGEILISDTVYNSLDRRRAEQFHGGESRNLKNVHRPVAVWRCTPLGEEATLGFSDDAQTSIERKKLTILVLPFESRSTEPGQDYFTEGITEDIVTELNRFRELQVIDRNSVLNRSGEKQDLVKLASDLGASYLIQGSVRRAGNRIRLTAQLVNATNLDKLWIERFDRDLVDVFALQDELSGLIVRIVAPLSIDSAGRRIATAAPKSLAVWETVALARFLSRDYSTDGYEKFRAFMDKALVAHPDVASLHSLLARWLILRVPLVDTDYRSSVIAEADRAARAAIRLDPMDGAGYSALASVLHHQRRPKEALDVAKRGIELNPNTAAAFGAITAIHGVLGAYEESKAALGRAIELSPYDPHLPYWYAAGWVGAFVCGHYEHSLAICNASIDFNKDFASPYRQRAASLVMLDRVDEARADVAALLERLPNVTVAKTRTAVPMPEGAQELFLDALRTAGLPE
jgi:TolB-like protein